MRANVLKAMPYYGGKARARLNTWLQSLLPTGPRLYLEPFAGQLAVLLNRAPAPIEMASDANGHIMRWWEAVRMHPEEMSRRILATPIHRGVHEQASRMLFDGPSPAARLSLIDHAWAVSVVMCDSVVKSCMKPRSWASHISTHDGRLTRSSLARRIPLLAERVARVQFETRPACQLLERSAQVADALIYCDPPYRTTDCSPYGAAQVRDWGSFIALLREQRGRVAVSGHGTEFDELGWTRHEFPSDTRPIARSTKARARTEVLWTNY